MGNTSKNKAKTNENASSSSKKGKRTATLMSEVLGKLKNGKKK